MTALPTKTSTQGLVNPTNVIVGLMDAVLIMVGTVMQRNQDIKMKRLSKLAWVAVIPTAWELAENQEKQDFTNGLVYLLNYYYLK